MTFSVSNILANHILCFKYIGQSHSLFQISWPITLSVSNILANHFLCFKYLGQSHSLFQISWPMTFSVSNILANHILCFKYLGQSHFLFQLSWPITFSVSNVLANHILCLKYLGQSLSAVLNKSANHILCYKYTGIGQSHSPVFKTLPITYVAFNSISVFIYIKKTNKPRFKKSQTMSDVCLKGFSHWHFLLQPSRPIRFSLSNIPANE